MSIKIMNLVWENAEYSGNTMLTLLALADWSNDEGYSFPHLKQLARKSRQSERNVQRALAQLCKDGVLSMQLNRGHNARNEFILNTTKWRVRSTSNTTFATVKHDICDTQTRQMRHRNKEEPSVEPPVEPSGKTITPNGAVSKTLKTWLQIKAELQAQLPAEEFNLWLRPMFYFKELSYGVLLLSLPPNKRIVEAARSMPRRDLLVKAIQAKGLKGFALTGYPDRDVLLNLCQQNSEWGEAATRILNSRSKKFVERYAEVADVRHEH